MRHVAASLLVLGSLLLGGCKKDFPGIEIDARTLIPKEATLAAGFEVAPISSSALSAPLGMAMRSDADLGPVITAIGECKLDTSTMRGMLASNLEGERYFGVIEAPGVGDEDMVRCIEKEVRRADKDEGGIILFQDRGKVRVTPQEGGGYLIIFNPNMIGFVDSRWETAVFNAIEDESARNTDSVIAKAVASIPETTDLWLTFAPSAADVADLGDVPGLDQLSGLSMLCDLSSGLELALRFDFPTEVKAKTFADALGPLIEEAKPALGDVGLPADLLDGMAPRHEGTSVHAKLKVSSEAFPGLIAVLGPMMAQ